MYNVLYIDLSGKYCVSEEIPTMEAADKLARKIARTGGRSISIISVIEDYTITDADRRVRDRYERIKAGRKKDILFYRTFGFERKYVKKSPKYTFGNPPKE